MPKIPKEAEVAMACPTGSYNVDRELLESIKDRLDSSNAPEPKEVVIPMDWWTSEVYNGSSKCSVGTMAWMANKKIVKQNLTDIGVFFHTDKGKLVASKIMPKSVAEELAQGSPETSPT